MDQKMEQKIPESESCDSKNVSDTESGLRFIPEMYSDVGICKKVNQDACCVRVMRTMTHTLVMAAVCDGVGGLQEGEYASKNMIQALNNWFDYVVSKNVHGKRQEQLLDYMQEELEKCVQEQNRMIYEYAKNKGIQTGTTLTLLVMIDRQYITAQVGDSRAYCINDELVQLTEDQSLIAREIREGRLTKEEARHDKRRNIILQCIGALESLCIDYKRGKICAGQIYFLCSDGFVHELEDDEIKELLCPKVMVDRASVKKCLKNAVSEVKRRGEKDNITVVLIKVSEN